MVVLSDDDCVDHNDRNVVQRVAEWRKKMWESGCSWGAISTIYNSVVHRHVQHPIQQSTIAPTQPVISVRGDASTPQTPFTSLGKPITKADRDARKQAQAQHAGAPAVMVADGAARLDALDAPDVDAGAVAQGEGGDDGEGPGGRERDAVAEVEQRGGDGAEDDGKFELWVLQLVGDSTGIE